MIDTLAALERLYPPPAERAVRKQLAALDEHCARFIELSPFVVLATASVDGLMDASPRGGAPGFIQVVDAHTLRIPDAPGNRRLDSLRNIIATGRAGLLFMIPGVDETLRVNGRAVLNDDAAVCATFNDGKRTPPLVIEVRVEEAYLHCAKAFMRSKLWSAQAQVERSRLPSSRDMLIDHTGIATPPESREEMIARYQPDL